MASLGGRLKSLGGKRGRRYGGWFRADPDGVIRGWVVDEADAAHRAEVEVRVDGQSIGRARADRLDATLVENGRGDGCYGFAVLVPPRFRDGRTHTAEAQTSDTAYRLMSKAAEFQIAPSAAAPALRLLEVGPEGARGRLRGVQSDAPPILELWTGGRRQRVLDASWSRKGADQEFRVGWDPETFAALQPDATIAIPGMMEAGFGAARLLDRLRLVARPAPEGVRLTMEGPYRGSSANPLRVKLVAQAGEAPLAETALECGTRIVPLPPKTALEQLRFSVSVAGRPLTSPPTELDLAASQLVSNAGFRRWDGQAPRSWRVGLASDQVSRGFAALPEARAGELGLRGDLVRLQPGSGDEAGPLLSQSLAHLPVSFEAQAEAALTCVARASPPLSLELRLTASGGEVLRSMVLECAEPWAWGRQDQAVDLAQLAGRGTVSLELWLAAAPPAGAVVEVAALGLAGEGRFSRPAPPAEPADLIEQGAFEHWPHGVSLSVAGARREIAEGWFVQNRGSPAPVLARAAPLDQGAALLLSAPEVADYCRLEGRLDAAAARGGAFRLGFRAGASTDVPARFQTRAPFTVIDRIFVLRRGGSGEEAVIASVTRRVPVERTVSAYEFAFQIPQASADEPGDLFLAFDFAGPFALRLQDVRIARARDADVPANAPALEDPAIAAQARTLKGLKHWAAPEPSPPGLRFQEPAQDPEAGNLKWTGAAPGGATVEVVVCVHDAADETLACLGSLTGTTSIPHTVLIVDDASGADTRARIEGYVADKPWMRMISNPANLGYTASANLGLRASGADWVVLLNSDTLVTLRWLEGLLECAAATGADFVGPVSNAASYQSVPELKDRRGRWKTNALPAGWTPEGMAVFVREHAEKGFPATPLLNGFCTLIRREAFLLLGGFNEAAFPRGYGEENDLCVRAAEAGYKLAVADHVYVHHAKSASFGAERRAELQKQASEALRRLHPDVDFTELGDRIREAQPLVRLRAAVRAVYEAQA